MDIKTESTWLMFGDCLERMKEIPDGSVDMILCDLPYGTTACSWDSVIPLNELWREYERVSKNHTVTVLTSSQPFTTTLISSNMRNFRYCWVWEKEQGVNFLSAKKAPLKVHEDVIVFYKDLGNQRGAAKEYEPLRKYLQNERKASGLKISDINKLLGNVMSRHYFTNDCQFGIPDQKDYEKLQSTGFFNTSYTEIRNQYLELGKHLRPPTYNPQMTSGKCYISGLGHSGEVTGKVKKTQTKNTGTRYPRSIQKIKRETGLHPTQKPVELMEYMVKTYSNEGEVVLDNTMGSGTTGVACKNTNRKFIGIEMDPTYYGIACGRILS